MPPKARLKHANQHDKRHDAGLAAPGKRITRGQASPTTGSHLPASPIYTNGRPLQSPTPPPQYSSTASSSVTASPRPELVTADSDGSNSAAEKVTSDGHHSSKEFGPLLGSQKEAHTMENKAPAAHATSEAAVTRETSVFKSLASQASAGMSLAATILSACPLRDAVAILIILLSLPVSMIIVTHSLFASLTFVPPAAGFSWGPWPLLPSFSDWFHATPGGGPSLFTIFSSDLLMIILHLTSPIEFQSIFMDLAHAVIALSLSGAAAGTDSSTQNVAFCSTIIFAFHLARYRDLHITVTEYIFSTFKNLGLDMGHATLLTSDVPSSQSALAEWLRLLLGCHILAQGLLTLLRRWFAGANQKQQQSKLDAEQAALLDSGKLAMLNLATPESASVSGPSSLSRESKEKASNRKKRKMMNQARVQQPLWAALASTKITYMKEMEQKYLTEDRREVTALAPTSKESEPCCDRFWIVDIGPTSINFRGEMTRETRTAKCSSNDAMPTPGVDKDKPFFVRLNGADWGSTRIGQESGGDAVSQVGYGLWSGEIYGLSPLTKYTCEFVAMGNQSVRFTTNFITLSAPNTEQVVTIPAAGQPSSLRPMSPTSTLKQSISVAESKREEVRNKLKRVRKDQKTSATTARREIEQLQTKVASSGGQDEKSRQRILQLKQHVKQAEESIDTLKTDLGSLGEIPEEDVTLHTARRRSFEAAMEDKSRAKDDLDAARIAGHKELASLQAEIASTRQKRDRLDARRGRARETKEKLVSEANAGNAQQAQARAQALDERIRAHDNLVYAVEIARREGDEAMLAANELLPHFEGQPPPPPTPEGDLPGTTVRPLQQQQQAFEMPPFGQLTLPAHQHWSGQQQGQQGFRQRSSSMLSGFSGFTDEWGPINGGLAERGSSGSEGSPAPPA